jgi:hypothetical protein
VVVASVRTLDSQKAAALCRAGETAREHPVAEPTHV